MGNPYTGKAASIERAISELEGWSFGRQFKFTTINYQLHTSIGGGWNAVDKFRELPGLSEFAEKLNAAIEPIVAEYALELRQALANECTKIAARAIEPIKRGKP
jgi:hypothetical protein